MPKPRWTQQLWHLPGVCSEPHKASRRLGMVSLEGNERGCHCSHFFMSVASMRRFGWVTLDSNTGKSHPKQSEQALLGLHRIQIKQ